MHTRFDRELPAGRYELQAKFCALPHLWSSQAV